MKKRLLSVFVAAAMIAAFCLPAYANEGTTTVDTAWIDLEDRTEIYVVTDTAGDSYPYYGAMYEPDCGTYYGRVAVGGWGSDGYGLGNGEGREDESAVSYYTYLGDEYSLEYWSYIYGSLLEDGSRAFLVHLNFDGEASDCPKVVSGTYDSQLIENFRYLATLDCPVFMRIGGEMNVWTDAVTPEDFIAAYRHIAELGRTYAPNVALVFSPNYSSEYLVDMDDYYPGDEYVDWIGVSLYYDDDVTSTTEKNDKFRGVNSYADPLLNIQQAVNLADIHQKPIIVTETGSRYGQNGTDLDYTEDAAERVSRAYSFLTMVYPQVKCILYSDTDFGSVGRGQYALSGNETVKNAYETATEANPTLLHSLQDTASYYTPISDTSLCYDGSTWLEGTVELAAYTYDMDHLSAGWYVDGELQKETAEYPYSFTLDTSSLDASRENHTLEVRFSNGASKIWTFYVRYADNAFWDVPDDQFYTDAVEWAVETEVTTGTTEHTFRPFVTCSRAQIVTFLWRAKGCPAPESSESPFTDIVYSKDSDWYYDAVLWAVEQGITNGVDDEHFNPTGDCTRAEAVTFLWRANESPAPESSESPFTDIVYSKDSAWYYDAVLWAVEQGITNGTGDNQFTPTRTCTRAEIVTFLWRAEGEPAPSGSQNFDDVSDDEEDDWWRDAAE